MAVITGTAGNDSLTGTGSADTISGLGGNDTINAGAGADSVSAGTGDDSVVASGSGTLDGGSGNDTLDATSATGAVSISGGAGTDIEFGGSGADTLNAGSGNDVLDGRSGNDVLQFGVNNAGDGDTGYGGPGTDTYQFYESATNASEIDLIDYASGEPIKIQPGLLFDIGGGQLAAHITITLANGQTIEINYLALTSTPKTISLQTF